MFRSTLTALPLVMIAAASVAATPEDVVETYADIAEAAYGDSSTAQALREAIGTLVESPSEETLNAAREAYTAARVPYQQTEAYRFGNPIADDWEGRVNAWPLDEGLIDYVAEDTPSAEDNELAQLNVIANPSLDLPATPSTQPKSRQSSSRPALRGAGGIEANVASGYHAIEFLPGGRI